MKKIFVFTFAICVLFAACTRDTSTGPVGPQGATGPNYTGNLMGHVNLYNEYGDEQPHSTCTSIRVILYNMNNQVVDSVNCDTAAVYSMNNIPTGDYTMAFRDTGYGELLRLPFQNLGGGTIYADEKLSHIPNYTFTILGDSIKPLANDTEVVVYGTLPALPQPVNIALFFGATSAVSSTPGSYVYVSTTTVGQGGTIFSFTTNINNFYYAGLTPGSMLYIKVYAAAYYYASQSEYEDAVTGYTVYNALANPAAAPKALKL